LLTDAQIEARVLGIFDVIKSGANHEDALVELKADWPAPQRAARRLAGHANAARGEGILWVIGLDETHGATRLTPVDLSEWWAQVRGLFDGPAPDLRDLIVRTADGPVHALHFDVGRSPYVVRNPAYGSTGGGPIEREVPWREGTAVRTATREDLIRLLVPVLRLPEVEILSGTVVGREPYDQPTRPTESEGAEAVAKLFVWQVSLEMYVTPPQGEVVVLPVHRTHISVKLGADGVTRGVDNVRYFVPGRGMLSDRQVDSVSVETTSSEAIMHLPGRLMASGNFAHEFAEVLHSDALTIVFSVQPVHTDRVLQTEAKALLVPSEQKGDLLWAVGS
jgi:hypothetical protein